MKVIEFVTLVVFLSTINISLAEDEHGHEGREQISNEEHKEHERKDDHDNDKDQHEGENHHEHGDHEGGKSIGKGKAIEQVDEEKGFMLSKEAIKTLGIRLEKVESSQFHIGKSTLVASKDTKGVYRFRAGFFKLVPVEIIKEDEDGYRVKTKEIDFGDQIVIGGVGLLRVSDIYSTDKAEYGHSH